MYQELPITSLLPHPYYTSRISDISAKKACYAISHLGYQRPVTVRPHPRKKYRFEVLDGFSIVDILQRLNTEKVRCDIWKATDGEAMLYQAINGHLNGTEAAELRINLLWVLLNEFSLEELTKLLPENISYLKKLILLTSCHQNLTIRNPVCTAKKDTCKIEMNLYLSIAQHAIIQKTVSKVMVDFSLDDPSSAVCKLAELYATDMIRR